MEQFPKSKFVTQKRALERRKVFLEQLDKMENFLLQKDKIMKKLTKKRIQNEAKLRVLQKAMTGIQEHVGHSKPIVESESSSTETESSRSQEEDDEVDLSDTQTYKT